MRNILTNLAFLASTFATGSTLAASWNLDPAHTRVGFSVKHMMVTDVQGAFSKVSGTAVSDDKDMTKSTLNVEVETASVNTGNEQRDGHLKGADFFMSDKFPKMTFKSTKFEKAGAQWAVTGDLTIRDVTKPVTLTVDGPSAEMKTPFGTTVSAVHATGKINRTDFGLKWNKTLEAGGMLVGDDVTLIIDAELVKQEAAKAEPAKKEPAKKK